MRALSGEIHSFGLYSKNHAAKPQVEQGIENRLRTAPEFAGGFAFRLRYSAPKTNRETAVYLLALAGNAYMHRVEALPESGEVIVPFPLMTTEHNPGKHHAMKAIRLSFRQLNPEPVEVVVSIPVWQESPFIPIRWRKDQGE